MRPMTQNNMTPRRKVSRAVEQNEASASRGEFALLLRGIGFSPNAESSFSASANSRVFLDLYRARALGPSAIARPATPRGEFSELHDGRATGVGGRRRLFADTVPTTSGGCDSKYMHFRRAAISGWRGSI